MRLAVLVFLPMIFGVLSIPFGRKNPQISWLFALITAALELGISVAGFFLSKTRFAIPGLFPGGLSLVADGFRNVYALVISGMWFFTLLFSREYFAGHGAHLQRYYFFIMMTEGAILGVFFAADLLTALVFFEIMSFTSFPWVIQEETEGAVRAAGTYLAIAVIGGLAALMGIWILDVQLGTTEIRALFRAFPSAETGGERGRLYLAGALILVGFGAKAGVFPLHIWLPKAHPVAPAPASALLSGVLTKSGVFGILVLSFGLFYGDAAWGAWMLVLGCITMLLGAVLALLSIDLKRTLACSSMSQIGFILTGIGTAGLLGAEGGLSAAGMVLHMVNHSLFKLVLFLSAGTVYMNLHELDLNRIRGFGRGKHALHAAFLLGALGIGGIPGFSGYISKTLLHEGIVEAAAEYGAALRAAEWIFLLSGGLTLAYMTKLYICLFHEKPDEKTEHKPGPAAQPISALSFLIPALLIPVFGLTGNFSMLGIARLSGGFFHTEMPEALSFFSLENLKGAGISAVIGAAVYFLVVRKLLMKDGAYVNRLPKWLDLEEKVYRPLLLKLLPGVFGPVSALFGENRLTRPLAEGVFRAGSGLSLLFGENRVTAPLSRGTLRVLKVLSRALSDMTDALVYFLRKTLFRPARIADTDPVRSSVSYRIGAIADRISGDSTKKSGKRRKKPVPSDRHAKFFYRLVETVIHTTHNLSDSMSFALLMLALAITAILFYVLFVHRFG